MSTTLWVAWTLTFAIPAATAAQSTAPLTARRGDHVDVYHGTRVADPYRWMEEMDAAETSAWVRAQDAHARRFVHATPGREGLRAAIARIADVTRYAVPQRSGDVLVYVGGDGSFTTRWLLVESPGEQPRVALRPEHFSPDGSRRLGRVAPDDRGRYVAYSVTEGQSRWERWRIHDLASGRDLDDELTGLNAAASAVTWSPDGAGFYYERLDPPAPGAELTEQLGAERLFFHQVGTPQSQDRLVYDPQAALALGTGITRDGRYLVVTVGERGSPDNRVLYRDLATGDSSLVPLVDQADATYTVVGNDGTVFWLYTNAGAPRGRVIAVDARAPRREAWRDLIPEAEDVVDTWLTATAVGDRIVVGYRRDAWLAVKVFRADGRFDYELELPKVGSIWSFAGRQGDPIAYYTLSDFTDPGTVYRLDVRTGESTVFRRPELAYDPDAFVTRQVFYESVDGTRIPMFLTHRRDIDTTVPHPTFMYGYGAFNWAASPWFQPHVTAWLQMGGVYALPNIRGGGEYGEEWHQAGIKRNKQTSIDDYLAAAQWLLDSGYTSRELLVANGGSASGPLVGAAITQRPDLFAASIIDFPALDMLRLEAFTGGRGWRSDFGTAEDEEDFRALLAYSPYHQVREGTCYPATLVTPGERDETTVPMHAYKFVAALQHAQSCDNPIMLRISWGAGHSYGATQQDAMENWADQISFLIRALDLRPVLPNTRDSLRTSGAAGTPPREPAFGEVRVDGHGARDLVLMPCLGCDATSWTAFMERNRERYRMAAVTWPGMGTTTLPIVPDDPEGTPYFDYLMDAIGLLIERGGLDRPVLVGHSAAAVAALRFAAERPELVSGVVNVDAIVANRDTYGFTPEQRRAWADAEMAEVLRRYDDDEAWARLNAAPAGMASERGAFYQRMWLQPPRQNVFAYWRDWLRTDAGALLPGLSVPFLAIHALPEDPSRAADKRADLEDRYRRAPMPVGARVVYIQDSGHTVWEYRPEAFDRALAEFVLGSAAQAVANQ